MKTFSIGSRLFGQEHMFRIGVRRILSGTVSAEQAGEAFARLADVIIRGKRFIVALRTLFCGKPRPRFMVVASNT